MAARVTAAEVKAILDNSTLDDTIVDTFITGANAMVNQVFSGDTTLSSSLKKEIERWLTAHMISSTRERMAKKEGAGGASIEYTGVFEKNLSSTPYGQMVMTLDSTGLMASAGGKSATITAIESFDD